MQTSLLLVAATAASGNAASGNAASGNAASGNAACERAVLVLRVVVVVVFRDQRNETFQDGSVRNLPKRCDAAGFGTVASHNVFVPRLKIDTCRRRHTTGRVRQRQTASKRSVVHLRYRCECGCGCGCVDVSLVNATVGGRGGEGGGVRG